MSQDKLARIEDKIDKISDKISSIDATLAAQHVTLEDHTRRSLANEEAVKLISNELKPIVTHVAIVKFVGKLTMAILTSEIMYLIVKGIIG